MPQKPIICSSINIFHCLGRWYSDILIEALNKLHNFIFIGVFQILATPKINQSFLSHSHEAIISIATTRWLAHKCSISRTWNHNNGQCPASACCTTSSIVSHEETAGASSSPGSLFRLRYKSPSIAFIFHQIFVSLTADVSFDVCHFAQHKMRKLLPKAEYRGPLSRVSLFH